MQPSLPNPTEFELAILRVLWKRGPSTVRDVQAHLGSKKAYTTVLSIMQIMTDKGFIVPDKKQQAFVYSVTVPAQQVQKQLVGDLLARAFGGAAQELVMQALSAGSASKEDLRAIRGLINQLEKKK
jgi:predicted transcriptional regulator